MNTGTMCVLTTDTIVSPLPREPHLSGYHFFHNHIIPLFPHFLGLSLHLYIALCCWCKLIVNPKRQRLCANDLMRSQEHASL